MGWGNLLQYMCIAPGIQDMENQTRRRFVGIIFMVVDNRRSVHVGVCLAPTRLAADC